jgi:rare lipoprotein A
MAPRPPGASALAAAPAAIALAFLALSACTSRKPPPPPPTASPHYVLGDAYQADGHWYYPAESYSLDTTGIAAVQPPEDGLTPNGLTADGELRDPDALTAAMQTIQLPAIVRVTNLENGRQILVRVNDRGPASPGRLIALSPRAALLLQIPPDGGTRIRVQVDEPMSRRLTEQLGGGPKLRIATAPAGVITAESLPPPGGGPAGPATTLGAPTEDQTGPRVPDRLPEHIQMTLADPGQLFLECGSFGRFTYANVVAARLAGLGADVIRSREGRQTRYSVRVGPFATVGQADAALAQALQAGVIDARITVE